MFTNNLSMKLKFGREPNYQTCFITGGSCVYYLLKLIILYIESQKAFVINIWLKTSESTLHRIQLRDLMMMQVGVTSKTSNSTWS